VASVVALLELTGTQYSTHFQDALFVHPLLGAATVALALWLYRYRLNLKRAELSLSAGLTFGSLTAIISAVITAILRGASHQTLASPAPKSATKPIAMAVAAEIGGLPSLATVLVIAKGAVGAITARPILNALHVASPEVRGFVLDVAWHWRGERIVAFEEVRAFDGLGMGLNGGFTAVVVPVLLSVLTRWF
jgi:putative effector of murein hydrolase